MKLHIEKIRLSELKSFINSRRYSEMETIPISRNRARSYLHNPHSNPDDIVLYLGYLEKRLVAFRSLFADVIFLNNTDIRFAWCSGNWVHPDYRRKGFSEQLLKEAYLDWDKKLMFTNYAPDSERLYHKTGWFQPIHQFEGARAYLFPKTSKLHPASRRNFLTRFLFAGIDFDIALISKIRLLFFREVPTKSFSFKTGNYPDEECYSFLKAHQPDHAFHRYEKELQWIFEYPWITREDKGSATNYPFSQYATDFSYQTIKIYRGEVLAGFFIFSVRDGHLKTLYFVVPEDAHKAVVSFLKEFAKNKKIEVLTVYKKELASLLFKRKFPFLRVKRYGQKIYSTFDLPGEESLNFQDSDGDVIFT